MLQWWYMVTKDLQTMAVESVQKVLLSLFVTGFLGVMMMINFAGFVAYLEFLGVEGVTLTDKIFYIGGIFGVGMGMRLTFDILND